MNNVDKTEVYKYLNDNIYVFLDNLLSWNYKVINIYDEFPTLTDTISLLNDINNQNIIMYFLNCRILKNKEITDLKSKFNNYYDILSKNNNISKEDLLNSNIEKLHLYDFYNSNEYKNKIVPPLNEEMLSKLDAETEEMIFFDINNVHILEFYCRYYLKGKKICSSSLYQISNEKKLALKKNIKEMSKISSKS